ncbi:H+/nucleoside cotransporter [Daldinia caldariorum]|uniref:H+/nucleoside cotransporter n=1 Tax=Daldinia caldariorum TaxID=326644 RepID=UPI0020080A51|nr:H+/nucleoside cotransporter [Daldinia caldariorum]KAI1467700.1 H+/nucleoside cotransporter [Daldinia caldariorum]
MSSPEAKGHAGHNSAVQEGLNPNSDPTLNFLNEDRHDHSQVVTVSADDTEKGLEKPRSYAAGEKPVTDEDSANIGQIAGEENLGQKSFIRYWYGRLRAYVHLFIWLVFTAWWIYGLVRFRNEKNWLIPFLLYLAITLRIIFLWIPVKYVMRPVKLVWRHTAFRCYEMIPKKLHRPLAALVTVAVFLVGSMVPEETGDNTRARRAQSLFGLVVMIAVLTVTSKDWRKIPWHTVIGGMLTQFVVAVFVLRTQAGYDIFNFISTLARTLLGFADNGVEFLTNESVPKLKWFLTGVVPPIIFFVALVSLLYHVGLIQWFIGKFAVFFFWTLRVSGAEAVVAAATPFIGQGESAMLIRPFVPHMTMAEIHQIMTCGFATIAGSVLVVYIGLGLSPQALVSSCIMSIPASLAVSKMRYPETEETLTSGRVVIPESDEHKAANALNAFANGAWLGLKIAGMIIATLLCIIAFVHLIDGLLTWWGGYWGISDPPLTLDFILGYLFYPLAWLLGVPNQDLLPVGELIGQKIIINEYAAFDALKSKDRYRNMSQRAKLIATYACCGFGNIGSLGTQIGVLSQLAPERAGDVSRIAISALISGVISTLTSASVAGMLYTDTIGQALTS